MDTTGQKKTPQSIQNSGESVSSNLSSRSGETPVRPRPSDNLLEQAREEGYRKGILLTHKNTDTVVKETLMYVVPNIIDERNHFASEAERLAHEAAQNASAVNYLANAADYHASQEIQTKQALEQKEKELQKIKEEKEQALQQKKELQRELERKEALIEQFKALQKQKTSLTTKSQEEVPQKAENEKIAISDSTQTSDDLKKPDDKKSASGTDDLTTNEDRKPAAVAIQWIENNESTALLQQFDNLSDEDTKPAAVAIQQIDDADTKLAAGAKQETKQKGEKARQPQIILQKPATVNNEKSFAEIVRAGAETVRADSTRNQKDAQLDLQKRAQLLEAQKKAQLEAKKEKEEPRAARNRKKAEAEAQKAAAAAETKRQREENLKKVGNQSESITTRNRYGALGSNVGTHEKDDDTSETRAQDIKKPSPQEKYPKKGKKKKPKNTEQKKSNNTGPTDEEVIASFKVPSNELKAAIAKEQKEFLSIINKKGWNKNDVSRIMDLIKNAVSKDTLNLKDKNGDTLLHIVSQKGDIKTVDLLLKNGADVNAKNALGGTALHIACDEKNIKIIELLLANKATKVNEANNKNNTALHIVSAQGNLEIVTLLLKEKADVNLANNHGKTALHIASINGHTEIVKALLEKENVDVNAADNNGQTALQDACENGYLPIVRLLLEKGAGVDVANKYNSLTALHLACGGGYIEIVRALLEKGASINLPTNANNNSTTALHIASANGHLDVVRLLLEAENVDVNIATKNGLTALHLACNNKDLQMVTALLEKGAGG